LLLDTNPNEQFLLQSVLSEYIPLELGTQYPKDTSQAYLEFKVFVPPDKLNPVPALKLNKLLVSILFVSVVALLLGACKLIDGIKGVFKILGGTVVLVLFKILLIILLNQEVVLMAALSVFNGSSGSLLKLALHTVAP
jgi:hypothetical protein